MRNWQDAGSCDQKQIRDWWNHWPTSNVGVVLGPVSGIVDVETDSAEAEVELVKMFGGEVPRGPSFKSSRGIHRLFQYVKDLPKKVVLKCGPKGGIEFRIGVGGAQSVFPPSQHHSGTPYQWIVTPEDAKIPALPSGIITQLRDLGRGDGHARQKSLHPRHSSIDLPEDHPGLQFLARALQDVKVGKRNDTGLWLACQLRDAGIPSEAAVLLMTSYAEEAPQVEDQRYTEDEALATLRSAYSTEPREPAARPRVTRSPGDFRTEGVSKTREELPSTAEAEPEPKDDRLRLATRILGACLANPPRFLPIASEYLDHGTGLPSSLLQVYRTLRPEDRLSPIDDVTERLGGEAELRALLKGIGGEDPCGWLLEIAETAKEREHDESIRYCAKEVAEGYRRRRLARELHAAFRRIRNPMEDAHKVVAEVRESLDDLQVAGPGELRRLLIPAVNLPAMELPDCVTLLGDGMLPLGDYGVLVAGTGLGKSLLLLQLADAVARGKPFFGLPTTQVRVVVISLEVPLNFLKKRLLAVAGGEPSSDLFLLSRDRLQEPFDLASPRVQTEVKAMIRGEGIGLTIVDPLSQAHRGGELYDDLAPVLRALQDLAGQTASAILLSHHEPKPQDGRRVSRDLAAARGASQIVDFAATVMRLKEERGRLHLVFPKVRYARPAEGIWMMQEATGLLVPADRPPTPKERGESTAEQIRTELRQHPDGVSASQLARAIRKSTRTVTGHIMKMPGVIQEGHARSARYRLRNGDT